MENSCIANLPPYLLNCFDSNFSNQSICEADFTEIGEIAKFLLVKRFSRSSITTRSLEVNIGSVTCLNGNFNAPGKALTSHGDYLANESKYPMRWVLNLFFIHLTYQLRGIGCWTEEKMFYLRKLKLDTR